MCADLSTAGPSCEHPLDGEEQDRRRARGLELAAAGCHTSAAGTSACTATMSGSARGSTLGEREPGTIAQIRVDRRLGRVQHQVPGRPRIDDRAQDRRQPPARPSPSRRRPAPPATRSSEPSERRPFVRSVFPLETRSTIASASPSRGADLDRAGDLDQLDVEPRGSSSRARCG